MRFVAARYYFETLFKDEADKGFLDALFNSSPVVQDGSLAYVIGNVELEDYKGYNFVRGTLGRLRTNEVIDIYDESDRTFKKQNLSEVADKLIEFLIEPSNHLMFIQDDHELKPWTVINKLMKIYANVSQLGSLKIDFVIQEKDVYKAIRKWDVVRKVKFTDLRPTNPSSKDSFKELENLLKETGSAKTDIIFQAPSKKSDEESAGLNYDSKLIRQPLALAAHGYGNAKLEGEEAGKQVQVQTSRFVRRVEVNFSDAGALEKIVQEVTEIQADAHEA